MSELLKGIGAEGFAGYSLTDQILYNCKWWLDWGLLHTGAFGTVRLGDAEATLTAVADERFTSGTVWNGVGQEWAWESGVNIAEPPFRVSGVHVDGVYYPTGTTGTCAHHIDYQHGRVIFDYPQNLESEIQVEYCWRKVQVCLADSPSFRVFMERTMDAEPTTTPSREHQVWLPALFLDERGGTGRGLQLGGGQIKTRELVVQIGAQSPSDRNLLMDWMDLQGRSAFLMVDLNATTLPFDAYGDVISGASNWPTMVWANAGHKLRFVNSSVQKLDSLNPTLFRGRADWSVEVDLNGV